MAYGMAYADGMLSSTTILGMDNLVSRPVTFSGTDTKENKKNEKRLSQLQASVPH